MLVLYWVPFAIVAGLVFTILSLIPRTRRWAMPATTGIVAAEPCFAAVFLVGGPSLMHALRLNALLQPIPIGTDISLAIIAGVAGGFAAGLLTWYVASVLPKLLLRISVVFAGWFGYFIVIYLATFFVKPNLPASPRLTQVVNWELISALVFACFLARWSEQFRAKKIHLPYGMPFRQRGSRQPTPPAPDAR